jgi:hypothetical protein
MRRDELIGLLDANEHCLRVIGNSSSKAVAGAWSVVPLYWMLCCSC